MTNIHFSLTFLPLSAPSLLFSFPPSLPNPFLFTPYYPALHFLSSTLLFFPHHSSLLPTLLHLPNLFRFALLLTAPLTRLIIYTSSSTQNTTLLYTSLSSWCIVNEFYRNRDTARYTARHVIYYLLLHFHFNYKN